MEHILITAILTFNIVLMVVYFIFRLNRRNSERADFLNEKAIEEKDNNTITDEKRIDISNFICTGSVPAIYNNKPLFHLKIHSAEILFVNKGEIEKGVNEFGAIIKAHTRAINFSPLFILDCTKKNVRYIKNDTGTILGIFTPFNIILIDTVAWKCTQSAEDDTEENFEKIDVTSYSKENVSVEQYKLKIKSPFLEPGEFIEKYYLNEFSTFLKRIKQK
jgi:hypothetical protein